MKDIIFKKVKFLTVYFVFTSISSFSQSYLDQIKVGEVFPENYDKGGWSIHHLNSDFSDMKCKAFKIDYIRDVNTTPGLAYEFERNGGVLSSRIYFFINSEDIVVGIRERDIVMYSGSNGLRSFLNEKKRISRYINDYPNVWKFLDEHEFGNLERYFAYTIENYNSSASQVVKIISIKDNKYYRETFIPRSDYPKLYIVNSPSINNNVTNNSSDIPYSAYKTTVNLNLRSQPIVNSDVLVMIPVGSYLENENTRNTENKDTFEINGEMITSNWVFTQYKSFKGWVFAGGLLKLKEYKDSNSDYIWEETNDKELFEKKFIYEAVYGDECNGEYAVANNSLVRLIMNIDENGLVSGEYGYVPCYESGTFYGEISGVARGNKISLIWKYSMEGMNYEEPLILIKIHESIQIINDGDYIKENGKLLKSNPREEWLKLVSEESKN